MSLVAKRAEASDTAAAPEPQVASTLTQAHQALRASCGSPRTVGVTSRGGGCQRHRTQGLSLLGGEEKSV